MNRSNAVTAGASVLGALALVTIAGVQVWEASQPDHTPLAVCRSAAVQVGGDLRAAEIAEAADARLARETGALEGLDLINAGRGGYSEAVEHELLKSCQRRFG